MMRSARRGPVDGLSAVIATSGRAKRGKCRQVELPVVAGDKTQQHEDTPQQRMRLTSAVLMQIEQFAQTPALERQPRQNRLIVQQIRRPGAQRSPEPFGNRDTEAALLAVH